MKAAKGEPGRADWVEVDGGELAIGVYPSGAILFPSPPEPNYENSFDISLTIEQLRDLAAAASWAADRLAERNQ